MILGVLVSISTIESCFSGSFGIITVSTLGRSLCRGLGRRGTGAIVSVIVLSGVRVILPLTALTFSSVIGGNSGFEQDTSINIEPVTVL